MSSTSDIEELLAGPRLPSHLYVHVPFCRSKCAYCDFGTVPDAPVDTVAAVYAGIEGELTQWAAAGLPGVLETVYIGGGTPSAWPAPTASLLHHIRSAFLVHPAAEVCVEANPDSLDATVAAVLSEAGATRISVGAQSFDDDVLSVLGRRHDAAGSASACRAVMRAGLELSVDLICGVPGQSFGSWMCTLAAAVATGARHISVYPLSLEEGTALSLAVDAGLVTEPDPDLAAEMMVAAEESLAAVGMERYEVASYAVPGHTSRHNTAYWTGRTYVGAGPGAHGMLDVRTARTLGMAVGADPELDGRVRYVHEPDPERWLTGRGDRVEVLTAPEALREDVMLGLRLAKGVDGDDMDRAGLTGAAHRLRGSGLLELVDGRWRTTRRGWLLGNEVFAAVWAGE